MHLKTIKDLDLRNKRVLLRADLNVPMLDGKVSDGTRIERLIPTLKYMLKSNAKIILISHFGRPEGKQADSMSLKQIVPELERQLGQSIEFIEDCIGKRVEEKCKQLKSGEILLLENLRFHQEEEENDEKFARQLASLADLYVNDAFSSSHRAHASIVGVTKYLPSYAGFLMEEEIKNLDEVLNSEHYSKIAIVGGKKVSSKFKILSFIASKVDYLVIAGAMANTFMKALGYQVGQSYYESEFVIAAKEFVGHKFKAKIILPKDFAVLNSQTSEVEVLNANELKESSVIYDLGPESVFEISELIKVSQIVLWNGPLGLFEDQRFTTSTFFIARFIAKLSKGGKIKSVVGGGDVVAAVEKAGVAAGISYISTAGGAFLEYLEKGDLPGIKVLKL